NANLRASDVRSVCRYTDLECGFLLRTVAKITFELNWICARQKGPPRFTPRGPRYFCSVRWPGMWQTCCGIVPDCDWWLTNGGDATVSSYGQAKGEEADVTVVPDQHLRWIERLPLMHVDAYRIFVHAGIDPNFPLDEQDAQEVIWKIYDDRDEGGHGRRHVVHGHHQHANGPILKKNRTNLDTFAWYTGHLVIGVFDDDAPGGPLEILEADGQPIGAIRATR